MPQVTKIVDIIQRKKTVESFQSLETQFVARVADTGDLTNPTMINLVNQQ